MANRITIGNVKVTGFVNLVSDDSKRIVIGTGSYTPKGSSEKVFKESITVFLDQAFDGDIPAKGKYVEVSGDLNVSPRKDDESKLNGTMNVRFKNQLVEREAPKAKAAEEAPAGERDI